MSSALRQFRVIYLLLMLNFLIPAISYIVAPELAIGTLDRINRALGGGAYPIVESSGLWHMLAVGNVMTLAFMCGLLLFDLRRFYPILPALAFLKAFSACYSLVLGSDPARSVVDPGFRVHGAQGLYVADASVIPTSLGVHPQGTIMALARVAADRIAQAA